MIYHNNYRARLIEEEDLYFITDVRLSEHVQENVGNVIFTNKILQKEWLAKVSKSSSDKFMIFEIEEEDHYKKLGMIRLSNIDFINRSVCVGGDISEEYAGLGHGQNMYNLIFKLGFDVWGMNRLWLSVLENNHRAIKLYKKMGFVDEGMQRKAIYKNGEYLNYLNMSILCGEYKNLLKN